jgi:hypothetical protein
VSDDHTFEITVRYDETTAARSSGGTSIEGWPDAPPLLVKSRLLAIELRKLAETWERIALDESERYQASLEPLILDDDDAAWRDRNLG